MQLYTTTQVDRLIEGYVNKGGEVTELEEGVLGHGKLVLHGADLRTFIVTEVPVNCWSSMHKVRAYNETPKKYLNLI